MGIYLTAKYLDQAGLILGFVSGMLLIPEVFKMIPAEKFERWLERQLHRTERFAGSPTKFSPPSWKVLLTQEQREAVEFPTACASFILSIVWIALLVIGLQLRLKILILLAVGIVVITAFSVVARGQAVWRGANAIQLLLMFLSAVALLAVGTPIVSLIRLLMLILRAIVGRIHRFSTTHDVLRSTLTIFAIFAFILSNVLQFLATLL